MPRLTIGVRWRIVSLNVDAGWSLREIAAHFNISIGAVQNILRVYERTEDVVDMPRSGRPRVTDESDDNFIISVSRDHPFESASRLQHRLRHERQVNTSLSTISRRLRAGGLLSFRSFRCLSLTEEHRRMRLAWSQHHRHCMECTKTVEERSLLG